MKTIAVTTLINDFEEVRFVEKEDGTYKKVIDEIETDSSLEELQEMINTGKYSISETMF